MFEYLYENFMFISSLFIGYFGLIGSICIFGRKKEKEVRENLRFAALIAARNEEECITNSIGSLMRQNYPKELLDIYVIPNNCTDNTESIAKEHGAKIIEVASTVKCKGSALKVAMDKLENDYDAFVVFDADNELNEEFISSMNKTLGNGYRVAKSRIQAKNRENSTIATCYDIHFATANQFLNRARVKIGMSARVIGTGLAIKTEFLKEIGGFRTDTITEDAEFYAICASKGEKIGFCEDAIAYDEQPLDFKTSLVQRRRWMSGIMQVFAYKLGDLHEGLSQKRSRVNSFDAMIQLGFCNIQAMMPFAILALYISNPNEFLHSILILSIKNYLSIIIMAMFVMALEKRLKFSKNIIIGIMFYPVFVFSFIPILTISLFRKTTSWKPIRHTGVKCQEIG